MNTQMTLAEAAAKCNPPIDVANWVFLLILFLALLRKLGLLPPDKDDDQYTTLGVPGGFNAAANDAKAKINAGFGEVWTKEAMCKQVDWIRQRYQTGNVSLV